MKIAYTLLAVAIMSALVGCGFRGKLKTPSEISHEKAKKQEGLTLLTPETTTATATRVPPTTSNPVSQTPRGSGAGVTGARMFLAPVEAPEGEEE